MILTGLVALLAGNAPLTALVGTRITPVLLPENSPLPAITYSRVGGSSDPTFETSGMQKIRVEFNCFGATYAAAVGAQEALRNVLNGNQGLLSDGTFLDNATLIQEMDHFENDGRLYRCLAEYYLFFVFP